MDLAGAAKAAAKLITSPVSTPFITQKANWQTQIHGVYNLLFTHMHDDFPIREETGLYVADRIKNALTDHNLKNKHNGALCTPGINMPVVPTQITRSQKEKVFIYRNISKNGGTVFNIEVKTPNSAGAMIFDKIGYGI